MTNDAAIGFAILAAKNILDDEQLQKVVAEMDYLMDIITEKQAEQTYREF